MKFKKGITFMTFYDLDDLERYADTLIGYDDIHRVNEHKYRDFEANAIYFVESLERL